MAKFGQILGSVAESVGSFFGISGLGDVMNGIIGSKSAAEIAQENANKDNVAFARETNAQSIALANSAHQREVADLKAAGLNPILSAGGSGAYTPGLAVPREDSLAPVMQTNSAQSISRSQVGIQRQQAASNIRLQDTQAQVNTAQVAKTNAETMQARSQAQLNSAQEARIRAELPAKQAEGAKVSREVSQQNKYWPWVNKIGQGWKDFGNTILDPVKGILGVSNKF